MDSRRVFEQIAPLYLTAGDVIPSGSSTVVHSSDCVIGCVEQTFNVSNNHLTDSALCNKNKQIHRNFSEVVLPLILIGQLKI